LKYSSGVGYCDQKLRLDDDDDDDDNNNNNNKYDNNKTGNVT
jgi:hypothetical protein